MRLLEEKLQAAYVAYKISPENQASVGRYLDLLKQKDSATYKHSLRVGLLASAISEFLHLDGRALLYAGLLHDVGKALMPKETLTKTEGFGEQDWEEMQQHPLFTYRLLRGIHDFSADIALRHHKYQTGSYPKELPDYTQPYSPATRATIDFYAMIVSLADCYDAASTRVNDKHGEKRALTKAEVKSVMLKVHPHFRKLIDELYRNGIFEDEAVFLTPIQQKIEEQANKDSGDPYSPRIIRRNVQLALALEPMSEKPGCTTRSIDCSRHLKLEYFIAGAVNVGDAFEDLALRLQKSNLQKNGLQKSDLQKNKAQLLLYDLALKAQLDSKRNRAGGRINEGMIEMLVPIVAAQMVYGRDENDRNDDRNKKKAFSEILSSVPSVLKNTSPEDVANLVALKRLSYDLCAYHNREVKDHGAQTVLEFYEKELAASERPVSRLHNLEILSGFPTSQRMFQMIAEDPETDLSERVRDAYLSVKIQEHKELTEGGLTADLCGIALYLLFSQYPDQVIVR